VTGASFTGTIEGTTLTVTAITFGTLAAGQHLIFPGVNLGTVLSSFGTFDSITYTGTGSDIGTYRLENNVKWALASHTVTVAIAMITQSATTTCT
jgi:hypothetical protein